MKKRFDLSAREYLDTPERKKIYNEVHFGESANRYDLATRGLSLGRDSTWKRRLVGNLPELISPTCVDVACGTGDVAFLLAKKYPDGEILGVDLTPEMIELANRKNQFGNLRFECRDMSCLELADESVDIFTGSYALRNAPDLPQALREFRRVMKPGGILAFLDFSKSPNHAAQVYQHYLLRFWGSFWGLVLHGNPEVHGYISQSLLQYPDANSLHELFRDVGFESSSTHYLFGKMMALHVLHCPA